MPGGERPIGRRVRADEQRVGAGARCRDHDDEEGGAECQGDRGSKPRSPKRSQHSYVPVADPVAGAVMFSISTVWVLTYWLTLRMSAACWAGDSSRCPWLTWATKGSIPSKEASPRAMAGA